MKKVLLTLLIFFSACSLFAQITLTSADMPSSGDTLRKSFTTNFAGINPRTTGASHTWDFSTLGHTSQTVDTFVSVLSTGLYAFYFSSASFALKSNTQPVSLGTITVDYQFDFFGKNSSSYVLMGMGANVSGLPVGVVNNPKDTLYRFPLDFNDMDSAASAFAVTVPGVGYYGGNRTRVDTVDGWGTLITPYGTFNTLRVKSVVNEIDTVYITSLTFGISLPLPERIEYKWLANGKKIPLLQITTTGGIISEIVYRDSVRNILTNILTPSAEMESINIYPNPTCDFFSVSSPNQAVQKIELFSLHGQKIIEKHIVDTDRLVSLEISTLPAGLYIVKVTTGKGTAVRKMVKH